MKYKLLFLESSYNSDRFVALTFGLSFESQVGTNYDQRYLILDEEQALILKIMFPAVRIFPVEEDVAATNE